MNMKIIFSLVAALIVANPLSSQAMGHWRPPPTATPTATATPTPTPPSHPLGIGVMYMITTDTVDHHQPIPAPSSSPFIDLNTQGVTCRSSWERLEPHEHASASDFYWTFLDACVAGAVAQNKAFSITIADGVLSPSWIYTAGAYQFNTTIAVGDVEPMPVPWDSVFQSKWGAMIHEVAARFGSNSHMAYIDLPIGHKVEGFFVKTDEDVALFNSLGGLTIWKTGVHWKIDKMATEFPNKPFILDLGAPLSTTEGQDALQEVCDYGARQHPGNHFAVASHGLWWPNGPGANSIGAKEAILLSSTSTPGFQVAATIPTGINPATGNTWVEDNLKLGISWGAKFIEIRPQNAGDPAVLTWGTYMKTH